MRRRGGSGKIGTWSRLRSLEQGPGTYRSMSFRALRIDSLETPNRPPYG